MFDDLQCPYCAQMHAAITRMIEQYGGRIRTIYKSFRLPNHSWGRRAAIAAECLALESGEAYWSFIDRIKHAEMDTISRAADPGAYIDHLALEVSQRHGVAEKTFRVYLTGQGSVLVEQAIKEGQALGVEGTPTIFVNGERVAGYVPESELRAAVDRQLSYQDRTRREGLKVSPNSSQ
jgi:protein-disulfide isomerase